MSICTLAQVREAAGIVESDTSQDDLILRLIGAVQKFVERRTRRTFSTGIETRIFDGTDKGRLEVDDYQELFAVDLLNPDRTSYKSFGVSTELLCEPYNKVPKRSILIQNNVSENPYRSLGRSPYIFPKGFGNIRVNANWGSFSIAPPDLEDIAISLVTSKLYKASSRGITSSSIGGESVSFSEKDMSDQDMQVLESYKRDAVGVW